MKPEIKKRWLEALRSGKYVQGRKKLRSVNDKYCCLGVLADLYLTESDLPWVRDAHSWALDDDGATGFPNDAVIEWAELPNMDPFLSGRRVTDRNDSGQPFGRIADLIEAEL